MASFRRRDRCGDGMVFLAKLQQRPAKQTVCLEPSRPWQVKVQYRDDVPSLGTRNGY